MAAISTFTVNIQNVKPILKSIIRPTITEVKNVSTVKYSMRGIDSVGNTFVYWSSNTPTITPASNTTTPPTQGNILNPVIIGSI